jgi:hypothetical protein
VAGAAPFPAAQGNAGGLHDDKIDQSDNSLALSFNRRLDRGMSATVTYRVLSKRLVRSPFCLTAQSASSRSWSSIVVGDGRPQGGFSADRDGER